MKKCPYCGQVEKCPCCSQPIPQRPIDRFPYEPKPLPRPWIFPWKPGPWRRPPNPWERDNPYDCGIRRVTW
jgi:hypothetical protein